MHTLLWSARPMVIILLTLVAPRPCSATGHVITSTHKIADMERSEPALLTALNDYVYSEYHRLATISQFLFNRSQELHLQWRVGSGSLARHPNGAYLLIHQFSQQWVALANAHPGLQAMIGPAVSSKLPSEDDLREAGSSLLRLQLVYELEAERMYAGDYWGHQGPALRSVDTYLLGRQAFIDGLTSLGVQWLSMALRLLQDTPGRTFVATTGVSGNQATPFVSVAMTAGLLGRCYFRLKDLEKAEEMYRLFKAQGTMDGDGLELRRELDEQGSRFAIQEQEVYPNMTELCSRPKNLPLAVLRPFHVCRYVCSVESKSYLRYKEEILSLSPFVSLFHDFLQDSEIEDIKKHVTDNNKLQRGTVGQGAEIRHETTRTSDTGWIPDDSLATARRLSHRVKLATGLDTDQRQPHGPSSGEDMQVVNYGLGGHYNAHHDPSFHRFSVEENHLLVNSGYRLATFLMYLSDVEVGGHTVFLKAGISVAPRKGMALFWYNLLPSGDEIDDLTLHAGCPVMIGEKWIANKWIRTYGNTFRRLCGRHGNSAKQQV